MGEGLGPQLHLNFEELNIREVFVRATHRYEVSSRVGVGPGGSRGSSEPCGPVEFLATWAVVILVKSGVFLGAWIFLMG